MSWSGFFEKVSKSLPPLPVGLSFTLKKANGQAFRSAEVQKFDREFLNGLEFILIELTTKGIHLLKISLHAFSTVMKNWKYPRRL